MKGVDTIARVRREFFVRGRTIKEICRELHVCAIRCARSSAATRWRSSTSRSVQPQPKIGAWREDLDRILGRNAGRPRRERLTLMRVFEELRGLGYGGG
jgi:hypothetical protein